MSSKSDILEGYEPSKQLAWWLENIDHKITPDVHNTLETYSNIPSNEVKHHVYAIREQAWSRRPWPCTGLGFFLNPILPFLPNYPSILATIKRGGILIDVGCYLGTDLRRLFLDGCPDTNLIGIDLVDHWDLGLALYRDEAKFHARFIQGDILDVDSSDAATLKGKVSIVSATHFLHNWNWATQVRACCALVSLLKPEVGAMIVGFQVGTKNPEKARWEEAEEGEYLFHTPETFGRMWVEVGEKTGTRWDVEARVRAWEEVGQRGEETGWLGGDAGVLEFVVTRIE